MAKNMSLRCTEDMTHSNIYKPQGMFHSRAIYFEGTPVAQRLRASELSDEQMEAQIQKAILSLWGIVK